MIDTVTRTVTGTVVLATCHDLPHGDEDADALDGALRRVGLTPRWQVWDDPAADWSAALVVLRSTWDYTAAADDFLAWARHVPHLANPIDIVTWSADKAYLADLAGAGIAVVPSAFAEPGEAVEFPDSAEFVVKPAVGAGSRGAGRFRAGELAAAREHVDALHADGRTVLVQPYLDGVDASGETALIYLAGAFSHAATKGAMLPPGTVHPSGGYGLFVEERIAPCVPSPAELALGTKVIGLVRERFGRDPLYARVDLLPGPDGPLVGELELVEPSLFLGHGPGAADRFAAAIAAVVRSGQP